MVSSYRLSETEISPFLHVQGGKFSRVGCSGRNGWTSGCFFVSVPFEVILKTRFFIMG